MESQAILDAAANYCEHSWVFDKSRVIRCIFRCIREILLCAAKLVYFVFFDVKKQLAHSIRVPLASPRSALATLIRVKRVLRRYFRSEMQNKS